MKFRDLSIGDEFDFVDDNSTRNSFFDRCVKTSTRGYVGKFTGTKYTVGSVNAKVYHIVKKNPVTSRSKPFSKMSKKELVAYIRSDGKPVPRISDKMRAQMELLGDKRTIARKNPVIGNRYSVRETWANGKTHISGSFNTRREAETHKKKLVAFYKKHYGKVAQARITIYARKSSKRRKVTRARKNPTPTTNLLIRALRHKGYDVSIKKGIFTGREKFKIPRLMRKYVDEKTFGDGAAIALSKMGKSTARKNPYSPYYIRGSFKKRPGNWYLGLLGGFTNQKHYAEDFTTEEAAKFHWSKIFKKNKWPGLHRAWVSKS